MSAGPAEGREGVVVSGLGVICSVARNVEDFAVALRRGCCGIRRVDVRGAAGPCFGAEIRGFDLAAAIAALPDLPPELRQAAARAARRSPLALRVAVAATLEAWQHAGLHRAPVASERLGLVVAGHNLTGRHLQDMAAKLSANPAYVSGRFALQGLDTDHVGTLSRILGVTGEGCTVGGASASGNLGLIQGSRWIEWGVVDACLVVGAMSDLSPLEQQAYFNLGAMAGQGATDDPLAVCRPFDRDHQGFVYGQGCACLVLESERGARLRGARSLARLAGYGQGLDGGGLADPREWGEARAMERAMDRAGTEPRRISYVNAHGTSSPLGDETEVKALRRALGDSLPGPWINSTKGLVGHCLGAAGVLEAVATVVQMRRGFVHPNLNLERPIDQACRFAGPRAVPARTELALSNSFGFGGFNSSLLLSATSA